MLAKLKHYIANRKLKELDPEKAYDLWSERYDDQPDNLMLALDEEIVSNLLEGINITGKVVADIGCGTGRHWRKIVGQRPKTLIGYDVSDGMLSKLKEKYPQANTYKLRNNKLAKSEDASCDTIISTLTIAHIENLEEAFAEWQRVLKNNGTVIITDYHSETLAMGGKRTFRYEGKTASVKNHIHTVKKIMTLCDDLKWEKVAFTEKIIDESVKSFYEKKNALHVYEKFKGMPIIFGMHLKKEDVVA